MSNRRAKVRICSRCNRSAEECDCVDGLHHDPDADPRLVYTHDYSPLDRPLECSPARVREPLTFNWGGVPVVGTRPNDPVTELLHEHGIQTARELFGPRYESPITQMETVSMSVENDLEREEPWRLFGDDVTITDFGPRTPAEADDLARERITRASDESATRFTLTGVFHGEEEADEEPEEDTDATSPWEETDGVKTEYGPGELVAVDFDGVLTQGENHSWHDEREQPREEVIDWVKEQYYNGAHVIVWTARTWDEAPRIAAMLTEWGCPYHGIRCEKGGAHGYVDDKASRPEEVLSPE